MSYQLREKILYSSWMYRVGAVGIEVRRLANAKSLNNWLKSRMHLVQVRQKRSYKKVFN